MRAAEFFMTRRSPTALAEQPLLQTFGCRSIRPEGAVGYLPVHLGLLGANSGQHIGGYRLGFGWSPPEPSPRIQ